MADINEEFSAAMAKAQAELAEFGVISDETAMRLKVAGSAVEKFEKKMQLATAATSALYQTFTSYNKAVTQGVKGYNDLAATTDNLATSIEAVSAALAFILPIGRAAKIVVAGLGLLAGELTRSSKQIGAQLDSLRSGFDTLAQVGATTADGLTGMYNLMQQLSMSTKDFEAFAKEIGQNAEMLSRFGGTVSTGIEAFGNLANDLKPMRNELMNFGIRIEQIGEASMGFVKTQRMFTLGNRANMDLSTKSMMSYVKELDAITRLTGISRKEQEKAMEEAMRHDAFVATLDDMVAQGKEKEAKVLLENLAFYKQKGPQALKAYMDSVSGFIGATEESSQGFLAAGGAIQDQIDAIKEGRVKTVADLAESNKQVNQAMSEVAETIGRGAAQLGVQFGLPYHEMRNAIQGATLDVTEAMKKIGVEQTKTDEKLKQQNELLIRTNDEMLKNQQTLQALSSAYQSSMGVATGALGTFTGALNNAAQAAANFFSGRSVGAGVGETSPGGADDSAAIMAAAGGGGGGSNVGSGRGGNKSSKAGRGSSGRGSSAATGSGGGAPATATPATPAAPAAQTSPPPPPPQTSMGTLPPGTVPPTPAQAPQLSAIREMIASVESRGNYNILVGGKTANLTEMTIAEVMQLQKGLISQGKGSAAGKYQVIYKTLAEVVGKMGLDYNQKFDSTTQDSIADFLIMRRGFNQYAKNATPEAKERFLSNLAAEWAGLPAGPDNRSRYAGVGNNEAHIKWNDALKMFADGGTLRGVGLVGEKGPELAVGSGSITSNTDIMGAFRDMISLLEQNQITLRDIANNSKSSVDINDRMLRIAQN